MVRGSITMGFISVEDGFADKAVMLGLSLDFLGIFIGSITDMET